MCSTSISARKKITVWTRGHCLVQGYEAWVRAGVSHRDSPAVHFFDLIAKHGDVNEVRARRWIWRWQWIDEGIGSSATVANSSSLVNYTTFTARQTLGEYLSSFPPQSGSCTINVAVAPEHVSLPTLKHCGYAELCVYNSILHCKLPRALFSPILTYPYWPCWPHTLKIHKGKRPDYLRISSKCTMHNAHVASSAP